MNSIRNLLEKGQYVKHDNDVDPLSAIDVSQWLSLQSIHIQNRQALLEFVTSVISQIAGFDKMSIYLLDPDHCSEVSFFHYCRCPSKIDDEYMRARSADFCINDGIFDVTLANDFPVVWNMAEVSGWQYVPERVVDCISMGINTLIGIPIIEGNRKIGSVFCGYKNSSLVIEKEVELLQRICSYISKAVVNIFALEHSVKKVKKVEYQLSLTNTLFDVRDKQSLLQILLSHLKPLKSFSGLMIILNRLDEKTSEPYILYFSQQDVSEKDDLYLNQQLIQSDIEMLESIFKSSAASSWLMRDLMKLPSRPHFLTRYRANNVKKITGIPLQLNEDKIGAFFLFSSSEEKFSNADLELLNITASPIAKSVVRINHIEEAALKDLERDIILSAARAFEVKGDAVQFQRAIAQVFDKVNMFDEGCIHFFADSIIDMPGMLLKQSSSRILEQSGFLNGEDEDESDQFLAELRQIKHSQTIDIKTYFKGRFIPGYISYWKSRQIRSLVVAPFLNNGCIAGIFFLLTAEPLSFIDKHLKVIDGVLKQVAASINHFFTNELLRRQIKEIDYFKGQLETQNQYLQEEIPIRHNFGEIVGVSKKIQDVFFMVSQVAKTDSSVLILGETGTGKELIARAIHNASPRKEKVMIKVNCGALPENLVESELFGHERGSFTGATERRVGKFEMANNSTLFLDEIGEMPYGLQVKLLRALQEKEIERLGGRSTIKVDVRIIAASNRDLLKEVQKGNFRQDLYFRLNVFPIHLPPLRDRKEDVSILANHFAEKHAKNFSRNCGYFTSKVMKRLVAYNWPGNVRELEHLVERSILLSKGKTVSEIYLPGFDADGKELSFTNNDIKTIDEVERDHILAVLKMANGKISGIGGAAQMLKIPATTLASKIIKLKISRGVV